MPFFSIFCLDDLVSVHILRWISPRGFSGVLGSLTLLDQLLQPLKFFWIKKQNGCHPIYSSSEKNVHKNKKACSYKDLAALSKDMGQNSNLRSYF